MLLTVYRFEELNVIDVTLSAISTVGLAGLSAIGSRIG